jgi:hypothetical protein
VVGENCCGAGSAGRGAEGIAAPRRRTSGAEARINFRTTSQRWKRCATQNHFASFRFRENSGLRACAVSDGTRSPLRLTFRALLPSAAVFELGNVRVPERDPFGAACIIDSGGAQRAALGASGSSRGCRNRRRPATWFCRRRCGAGLASCWRRE